MLEDKTSRWQGVAQKEIGRLFICSLQKKRKETWNKEKHSLHSSREFWWIFSSKKTVHSLPLISHIWHESPPFQLKLAWPRLLMHRIKRLLLRRASSFGCSTKDSNSWQVIALITAWKFNAQNISRVIYFEKWTSAFSHSNDERKFYVFIIDIGNVI